MKLSAYATDKSLLKKIAVVLLYVLVAYMPFVKVLPYLGGLKDLICVLICICVLGNRQYRFNWGTLCVFIYTFSVAVSVLCNKELDFLTKFDSIRYRTMYAITFCLLFNGFRFTKKELHTIGARILQIVLCAGAVVVVVGLLERLNPEPIYALYGEHLTPHLQVSFEGGNATRLISTMGNPINLGLQMCIVITAGLYFMHSTAKEMPVDNRVLCGLVVILSAEVLFFSYARTAYVVLAGTIAAFYLAQILFTKGKRKKKIVLLSILGSVVLVAILFMLLDKGVAARFGNIGLDNLLQNARFSRAYKAFSKVENTLWTMVFGHGAAGVTGATNQYVFEFGYASLLYESGILGMLMFAIPVGKSVYLTIKAIKKEHQDHLLMLAYCCFPVIFCLAMLTEDVYFQIPVVLYFWLGVFWISAQEDGEWIDVKLGDLRSYVKEKAEEVYLFLRRFIPTPLYLKLCFRKRMKRELNLNDPKTFNEKLQWLKIHDQNPDYGKMVDKYTAKQWAADRIGQEYIIPTLGVWDKFEDIDFDALPNQFVLKCTHDSGGLVIVRDKSALDMEQVRIKIEKSLKNNYYYAGREMPYKKIPKRIICEEYMTDGPGKADFTDYKFYCFGGNVDCVMLCLDRASGDTKFYFFDKNWELKRYNVRGKNAPENFTLPKPTGMDEMFRIAEELSQGIPFVRVDLYQSGDRVYFGEMTFFPDSGFDPNYLPETDAYFGSLIKLK